MLKGLMNLQLRRQPVFQRQHKRHDIFLQENLRTFSKQDRHNTECQNVPASPRRAFSTATPLSSSCLCFSSTCSSCLWMIYGRRTTILMTMHFAYMRFSQYSKERHTHQQSLPVDSVGPLQHSQVHIYHSSDCQEHLSLPSFYHSDTQRCRHRTILTADNKTFSIYYD